MTSHEEKTHYLLKLGMRNSLSLTSHNRKYPQPKRNPRDLSGTGGQRSYLAIHPWGLPVYRLHISTRWSLSRGLNQSQQHLNLTKPTTHPWGLPVCRLPKSTRWSLSRGLNQSQQHLNWTKPLGREQPGTNTPAFP